MSKTLTEVALRDTAILTALLNSDAETVETGQSQQPVYRIAFWDGNFKEREGSPGSMHGVQCNDFTNEKAESAKHVRDVGGIHLDD